MDALKVFISYRRADTQHVAGRLGDRISSRFTLFMDIDDIPLGVDFTTALNEAVNSSDVIVVLIGHRFLGTNPMVAPRAGHPPDWVVAEVSAALDRGLVVIPVLVDNAEMPEEEQLPEALWPLRRRQALRLSHISFNTDVDKLVDALTEIESTKQAPTRMGAAEPAPSREALFRDPDYSRAVAAAYRKQWSEAVDLFSAVQRRFPTDARVSTQLAEARAADAEARGEWYEAVTALQALSAAHSQDSAIEARLTRARREVEIGDLVGQLRALAAAEEWAGVAAMSQRIGELDPTRADPDGLAGTARAQLQAHDLDNRYTFGLAELDRGNHREAYAVFEAISREHPGYREADDLLRMAQERLSQADAPPRPMAAPTAIPVAPDAVGTPTKHTEMLLADTGSIWFVVGGMAVLIICTQAAAELQALVAVGLITIVTIIALTVMMRADADRLKPDAGARLRRWSIVAVIVGLVLVMPLSEILRRPLFKPAHFYTIDGEAWLAFLLILLGQVAVSVLWYLLLRRRLGRAAVWPALIYLACALLMTLIIVGSYEA